MNSARQKETTRGQRSGIVVLISGRGSNLQAIIDQTRSGQLPVTVRAVISNTPGAQGLERAQQAGIASQILDQRRFANRDEFERELIALIDSYTPQAVVLAGFMRILSDDFVSHYSGRLLNIHPSLLPAFPGLDTHKRAIENGATQHGASVHFVTNEVDKGPVIVQASVPVLPEDTPERLAERVLAEEHRIYPLAIRWLIDGRLRVQNERVLLDGKQRPEQGILNLPPSRSQLS